VLPRKEEILRAVKLHHKVTDGLLGKTLRKADQLARQKELGETEGQVPPDLGPVEGEDAPESPAPVQNLPPPPVIPATEIVINRQAWGDIYGEEPEPNKGTEAPVLINISRWFDPEAFLKELKPFINRLDGRCFLAFSMADGHVYFQIKVLEIIARKQAERAGVMEIAAMAQGDTSMRRVLYSIVHHLRTENEVIARGLIKDSFFGGFFIVTRKNGLPIKGYYTPFHAEAFGSIAEMEQVKPYMLRDFLKVSPLLTSSEPEKL